MNPVTEFAHEWRPASWSSGSVPVVPRGPARWRARAAGAVTPGVVCGQTRPVCLWCPYQHGYRFCPKMAPGFQVIWLCAGAAPRAGPRARALAGDGEAVRIRWRRSASVLLLPIPTWAPKGATEYARLPCRRTVAVGAPGLPRGPARGRARGPGTVKPCVFGGAVRHQCCRCPYQRGRRRGSPNTPGFRVIGPRRSVRRGCPAGRPAGARARRGR